MLSYGILIVGKSLKKNINKIQILQNKILRILFNYKKLDTKLMYKELKIKSFQRFILMHVVVLVSN